MTKEKILAEIRKKEEEIEGLRKKIVELNNVYHRRLR